MKKYSAFSLLKNAFRHITAIGRLAWRKSRAQRASTMSSSLVAVVMGWRPRTTWRKSTGATNIAVLEKGWIGGGNTGRNTTIVRSNYLWTEASLLYEKSLQALGRD